MGRVASDVQCLQSSALAEEGSPGGSASLACLRPSSSSSVRAVFARISSMPPIILLGGKSSGICSNIPLHASSIRACSLGATRRATSKPTPMTAPAIAILRMSELAS